MADYNVNMKQWNGTSFDNVLPLAYDAKQLGGQSLAEVKQWVYDNGLLLYTGQYTGTGTYGQRNPISLTFPFEPVLFFMPSPVGGNVNTIRCDYLTESYQECILAGYGRDTVKVNMSKSVDGRTISWYASDASSQQNENEKFYYFAAIGGHNMGGPTEWVITSSGSYTVPKTGRYMLELYGGGGGTPRALSSNGYTGGSSCQHYDSVSLNAGNTIQVVIGAAGKSSSGATSGGSTSFGSYTVLGGGAASDSAAGGAAGNYGKSGVRVSRNSNVQTYNDGVFGTMYGVGSSNSSNANGATAGAVYLKYLGA